MADEESPKPDQDEEAPDTAQTGETIDDDAEGQIQILLSEPAASPDIAEAVPEDTETNMGEPTEDVAEERDQTPTAEPPPSPSIVGEFSEDIHANMGEADVVQGDLSPTSEPLSSPYEDILEDSERNMTHSDEITSGMIISSLDEISDAQDRKTERSRASSQSSIQDMSLVGLPNLSLQLQCPSNVPLVCDSDNESDMDDEQAELVVLDPDHPLMKRFQEALKSHLSKQLNKLTLEIRDLIWRMKKQTTEREDTGVILYGAQQSLAQIQMELEKLHDYCSAASAKRQKTEEDLAHIRNLYQVSQTTTNSERSKVSQLQTEVENIALRHFYMENLKHDVCSDIMVMKRATEKLEIEKVQAAKQKQKQDMFVDRLVSQIDALREQIAMYEAQYIAQAEETKAARKTVAEASTEIDAIGYEKKQLLEQWNTSVIGMQRRDEAYSAMQKAVGQSKHQLDTLRTEMHAYKSFIMKQEEKNEFLTVTLNRLTNDVNMTQKMIMQNLAKQEGLKHEYSTYTRTLHETERLLNKASLDKNTRQSEIKVLQLQIEREYGTKVKLEDEIMAKWESNMTMNQATNYLKRLCDKLRIRKRQLEIDYAKTENEFAQISLDMNDRNGELSILQKTLQEQHHELNEKNQVVSLCEKEIAKRLLSIQNKQSVLNMHNKKIAQLIAEMGGREMSPLELKIKTLTKNIEEHSKEISTQQQYWLKQQQELVRLTQEREKQTADVELQRKQVTILEQKKIRTENMIQQELNAKKDIERHINALSHDMVKLNELLTKNTSMKNSLEQINVLMENEFVTALKDAEREAIVKQQKLDQLKEEKERLLSSLVEAERQIMLWEKKIQLAKEARSAVDSDVGQTEIRAMKAEIHRMQIRHNQLMRQQEQMIREMEAVVSRRDTIVTRGEAQAKVSRNHITKQDCHKKIQDLCKKIADTQKKIEECDKTIEEMRESQQIVCEELGEKQCQIQKQQSMIDELDARIESEQEKKQANLAKIVTVQTRLKYLQAVKEGKYIQLCKSEQTLRNETQKQQCRIHTISTIIARVQEEWPQYQGVLRKVTLAIAAQGTA
ncbi:coiled-coil domain-containing protein 40 isoform X1 [Scyliorhinus canicula]|uniref:coiled-coil domain-containing protein 40 isoform X1 n=1 Tax=Scyliorhinus canicula TaxID=7830 RepID=UPI0018F76243|nr:coiled-coil domain-containing protein 40 isoform X1 [Scyliorhinus canicula]